MKIKNISNKDLVLSLNIGVNKGLMTNIKPNQVMYCESKNDLNKQLVIYEKKQLISIVKDVEKPEYVGYYKPYFESGTYISNQRHVALPIVIETDEEDDDIAPSVEDVEIPMIADTEEEIEETVQESPKKGRGRPRKPISAEPDTKEKRKRGRPKGTFKKAK